MSLRYHLFLVTGNQHISQINPTLWSVILREHVRAVDLDLLRLCQVVFFDCVGAFYSCKTWPNNNTFVVKPFQQMCPGIVVRPIVEWTTNAFSQILFWHNGHPPRRFERKVAIDRIPMVLSFDRCGNVENQLSIYSWKFLFLGNFSTSRRTTSDAHFSRPILFYPA